MDTRKFSKTVTFDLNAIDDISLFEYFSLVRCAVLSVIEQKHRSRANRAEEITGVIRTAVSKLDDRYGRAIWSSSISEEADIFFEQGRGKAAMKWKELLNLFPNLYDNGFDEPVLKSLSRKPSRTSKMPNPVRHLLFDHETWCRMDYVEAFALCRCFLRHEIRHRLFKSQIELATILGMLATVLSRMDEAIGKEWVESIRRTFISEAMFDDDDEEEGRSEKLNYRERVVRLFPLLVELGLTDAAIAAWKQRAAGRAAA